tara:strand:- start:2093 stop:2446 length:354 start_codon:yes stop_codon:yes gene_type:complete
LKTTPIIIKNNIIPKLFSIFFPVSAVTLWPFIFVRKQYVSDKRLMNHETIHIKQYNELLVIGFLAIYLYDWFRGLIKYRDTTKAYYQIRFEQEAYNNQEDMAYLDNRDKFAWKKYKI